MRYEDMPKGRNKDRCVRCGKRYNFADKALSKAKVPYDLLCLAEVTTSGYMTHGNVKLCDECMVELLMWLDRKTESNSEKPNNCETCKWGEWYRKGYDITMMDDECGGCCSWNSKWTPKTEPTISKMEQVDKDINVRSKTEPQKDCKKCENYDRCKNNRWKCCVYQPKDEPQTDCAWR